MIRLGLIKTSLSLPTSQHPHINHLHLHHQNRYNITIIMTHLLIETVLYSYKLKSWSYRPGLGRKKEIFFEDDIVPVSVSLQKGPQERCTTNLIWDYLVFYLAM